MLQEVELTSHNNIESTSYFLKNTTYDGSYGEQWSFKKVLRRFIWHDRIHAKAIGAVLVHDYRIVGKMSNTWNTRNSKVHHAENYLVLENAQYLRKYGHECIIYTTLELCLMCIGTIVMADIRNIVIGFEDKYMQTREFIASHAWLRDRVFNYLVGIKEEGCKNLITRYGDERDKSILL